MKNYHITALLMVILGIIITVFTPYFTDNGFFGLIPLFSSIVLAAGTVIGGAMSDREEERNWGGKIPRSIRVCASSEFGWLYIQLLNRLCRNSARELMHVAHELFNYCAFMGGGDDQPTINLVGLIRAKNTVDNTAGWFEEFLFSLHYEMLEHHVHYIDPDTGETKPWSSDLNIMKPVIYAASRKAYELNTPASA